MPTHTCVSLFATKKKGKKRSENEEFEEYLSSFPQAHPPQKKKKLKGTYYISFRMSYVLILAFMDITLKQCIYLGNGILQFSSNLCKLQDMNYTIQLLKIQHWCYKIQLY